MKKYFHGWLIITCLVLAPTITTQAQIPIMEVIRQGIRKVIIAVDLRIQRLQNETIWLQNAQKTIENAMSKLRLTEISDWVERQRVLYADYFDELWRVKSILTYYHRVRDITQTQAQIIAEYKVAWALFRQDDNFTPEELDFIYQVYSGMLEEGIQNIDQLFLVVNAFATQMSDAKRLEIINGVADRINTQLMDLKAFNSENKVISLQRAAERGEIETVKRLYGLE